jgi:hypothetical protein
VDVSDSVSNDAVEFLWVRVSLVIRPQASFDVTHRYSLIETRQSGCHSRRRVAVHQHEVRAFRIEYWLEPLEDSNRDPGERLALGHDVEVEVRFDAKQRKDLVQHVTMLGGYDNAAAELRLTLL